MFAIIDNCVVLVNFLFILQLFALKCVKLIKILDLLIPDKQKCDCWICGISSYQKYFYQ